MFDTSDSIDFLVDVAGYDLTVQHGLGGDWTAKLTKGDLCLTAWHTHLEGVALMLDSLACEQVQWMQGQIIKARPPVMNCSTTNDMPESAP